MWHLKVSIFFLVLCHVGYTYRPDNHLVNHDVAPLPHGPRTAKITYQLPGRGRYRLDKPPPRRPGRARGRKVPRTKLKPVIEDITFEGNIGKEHLNSVFRTPYPYSSYDKKPDGGKHVGAPDEAMSQDDWQKLKELFFTSGDKNEMDFMTNDWMSSSSTTTSTSPSPDFDWVQSTTSSSIGYWEDSSSPSWSTSSSSAGVNWDSTSSNSLIIDWELGQNSGISSGTNSSPSPVINARPTPPKPNPIKQDATNDDRRPVTFDGSGVSNEKPKNHTKPIVASSTKTPMISYYDTDAPPGVFENIDESGSYEDNRDVKPIFEEPEDIAPKPIKPNTIKAKPEKFKPSPPVKHTFEDIDDYDQNLTYEEYDTDSFKPSSPLKFEEPNLVVNHQKPVHQKPLYESFKPSHAVFEEPDEVDLKQPKPIYRQPEHDQFRPSPPIKHPVFEEPEEDEFRPSKHSYDSFKPSSPAKHPIFEEHEEVYQWPPKKSDQFRPEHEETYHRPPKKSPDQFRPSQPIKHHPVYEEPEEEYQKPPQQKPPKPVKHAPVKKVKEADPKPHPRSPPKPKPPKPPKGYNGPPLNIPKVQKLKDIAKKASAVAAVAAKPPPPPHWHFDSYEDCEYEDIKTYDQKTRAPPAPKHTKRLTTRRKTSTNHIADTYVPLPEH